MLKKQIFDLLKLNKCYFLIKMGSRNKKRIYSIILTNHGKQKSIMCSEKTEEQVYKKFNTLLKKNKKEIVFPMRFNNMKHKMVNAEHELVIIKCKDYTDNDVNKIRSDSGEFINYVTNNEDWIVVDRAPYDVEETFWVYGYHPKLQRKDFMWVFNNFILNDSKDKSNFKTVQVYNNKVLIECNGHLEMVICKTKSDSFRMYNLLEAYAKNHKCKYVIFMGDIIHSKYKSDWIQKIKDLTNWSMKKILRRSTRD